MNNDKTITPEMLSFKDFMAAFRAQYRYGYPQIYGKYNVAEQIVRKNNKELHGLIIRVPGNRIAPVFYYEDFYKAYKNGTTIDECIAKIIEFLECENLPGDELGMRLTSWDKNRDHLVLKMINFKRNRKMLANTPFRILGDMAVIVQIYLSEPTLGNGAITVDNDLLRIWSVSSEELFATAMNNMNRYSVKMMDLMDVASCEEEDSHAPKIFMVSYDAPFQGASAILQTDILLKFAREKSMDFFVMPVSIYEILLIEKREEMDGELLFDMLKSINADAGLADNMLSEEVYLLERKQDCLHYLSDAKELKLNDN